MEDEEEMKQILKQQSQVIEDAINKIKAEKPGRVTNVFRMRELEAGQKKQKQEAHAVRDPETGENVVSSEEIKRVNLEHCVKVLTNNIPKSEGEELLAFQSDLHDTMMEDETDSESTITEDEFDAVLGKFKQKNKKSFHFITKSGEQFQRSIYKLCKRMIEQE